MPRNWLFAVKLVVSTISVFPSQRPRESPIHLADFRRQMRTSVQGDEARLVEDLVDDRDVAGPLQELIVADQRGIRRIVGEARKHRRTDRRPPETSIHQRPVFRAVGGPPLTLDPRVVESLLRRWRQRRKLPVRRIHDQRRSRHRHDPRVRVPPFAAVGTAKIRGGAAPAVVAIPPRQDPLLVLRRFLRRQELFRRRAPRAVPAASGSRWSRCPAGRAVRPACAAASSSSGGFRVPGQDLAGGSRFQRWHHQRREQNRKKNPEPRAAQANHGTNLSPPPAICNGGDRGVSPQRTQWTRRVEPVNNEDSPACLAVSLVGLTRSVVTEAL